MLFAKVQKIGKNACRSRYFAFSTSLNVNAKEMRAIDNRQRVFDGGIEGKRGRTEHTTQQDICEATGQTVNALGIY